MLTIPIIRPAVVASTSVIGATRACSSAFVVLTRAIPTRPTAMPRIASVPGRSPVTNPNATGTAAPTTAESGAATFIGPSARLRYREAASTTVKAPETTPTVRSAPVGSAGNAISSTATTVSPVSWVSVRNARTLRPLTPIPPRKSAVPHSSDASPASRFGIAT